MKAEDIKILGVTVTYNNEDKIPYVMPYYERIGIDKLVVYDNGSTDKTVEMLSKYPFVEIRSYITEKYDENLILKYKTEIQNEFKGQYHWCISTYFDEVFYSERDFREVLYEKMCEGKTYFLKTGLNIFSRKFPPVDNGKLIHENVGRGALWTSDDGIIGIYGNKVQLFDMTKVFVTYNEWGCHECLINGQISPFEDEIGFFHLKFIDFDFIVRSNAEYKERTQGTGIFCYDYFAENMEKVYCLMEKRAISIDTYMNSKMKQLVPQQVVFVVNEKGPEQRKNYVDTLAALSEKSIIQQYALLFYGDGDYDNEKWADLWLYAKKNGIYIMNDESVSNSHVAVHNHRHYFEKCRIHNPWIAEISSTSELTPEFFEKMEHGLKEYADKNAQTCNIHGITFMKYSKFVSNGVKTTLGCYMIVKNEEQTIGKCLDSIIQVCDEIVVVDTGCNDRTMDIVKSYGDKVKTYYFEWCNDFSAARNFALSKIQSDYSFTTDADEEFTPNLIENVINFKNNGFFGHNSIEIWLLNYNGTDEPGYYLGGRQIVKTSCIKGWRYKIHEKLYYDENKPYYLNKVGGYILHKHNNKSTSNSNYNKYAETYYNELNGGDFLSPENGCHFFYYMFLTLKNIDMFTAKLYLSEVFKKERLLFSNENIVVHLYRDGYISLEEFTAFNAIANYNGLEYLAGLSNQIKEQLPQYLLLKTAFETGENLSGDEYVNLAYLSYLNGRIIDFVNFTKLGYKAYPQNPSIGHNNNFCQSYVNKAILRPLVIDCTNGTSGLASNLYLFSKMFKNIKIKCKDSEKLKYFNINNEIIDSDIDGATVVDGNEQMTPQRALKIFEDSMYGRI